MRNDERVSLFDLEQTAGIGLAVAAVEVVACLAVCADIEPVYVGAVGGEELLLPLLLSLR